MVLQVDVPRVKLDHRFVESAKSNSNGLKTTSKELKLQNPKKKTQVFIFMVLNQAIVF